MKCTDILFSIIVPVYNIEQYLPICINSIISQTYTNLEIILVDDGSTDSSGVICDSFQKNDSRIKVIHKENGGVVSARKAGVNIATGEYIALIDGDDWIENNMFTELAKSIVGEGADIISFGSIRNYSTYGIEVRGAVKAGIYEGINLRENIQAKIIDTNSFYLDAILIWLVNKIFKANLYKKYQMAVDDRIIIGDDAACLIPCILNAKKIIVIEQCFYHYRIRNDSLTETYVRKDSIELMLQYLEGEMEKYQKSITNIMEQFKYLKCFYATLFYPEKIFYMRDNIFFPYGELKENDKVLLYGRGHIGTRIRNQLVQTWNGEIVAWIDKDTMNEKIVNIIENEQYDKIIIAVVKAQLADQICGELLEKGICRNKILMIDKNLLNLDLDNDV